MVGWFDTIAVELIKQMLEPGDPLQTSYWRGRVLLWQSLQSFPWRAPGGWCHRMRYEVHHDSPELVPCVVADPTPIGKCMKTCQIHIMFTGWRDFSIFREALVRIWEYCRQFYWTLIGSTIFRASHGGDWRNLGVDVWNENSVPFEKLCRITVLFLLGIALSHSTLRSCYC